MCAYVHGRRVVDLWAAADGAGPDSLYGVFSSTKGAAHLVVALLVQEGTLELDRKVTYYWPEFGAEGKGALTLRDLLAHRAGVVGPDGGFSRRSWPTTGSSPNASPTRRPFWRPGTAFGYHALVIGALTGEVVRRATGRTLQEVYEERVRVPYGLDFFLGLPEAHEPRFRTAQPMAPTAEQRALLDAGADGPHTLAAVAFNRHGAAADRPGTAAQLPAVRAPGPGLGGRGGVGARAGRDVRGGDQRSADGKAPLLKPDTAAEFGQIHSVGYDLVARAPQGVRAGLPGHGRHLVPVPGRRRLRPQRRRRLPGLRRSAQRPGLRLHPPPVRLPGRRGAGERAVGAGGAHRGPGTSLRRRTAGAEAVPHVRGRRRPTASAGRTPRPGARPARRVTAGSASRPAEGAAPATRPEGRAGVRA